MDGGEAMTRTSMMAAVLAMACGHGDDTGAADVYATCDEIECSGTTDEGYSEGYSSRGYWESVTCEWSCVEQDGRMVSVSRTWVREDDGCYFEANVVVGECSG